MSNGHKTNIHEVNVKERKENTSLIIETHPLTEKSPMLTFPLCI